jgi:hypothetical protein
MYKRILARASWNSKIVFSIDAVIKCIFWLKNVEILNKTSPYIGNAVVRDLQVKLSVY